MSRKKPYRTNNVPFARSYWVVPGKFLAGYYPGDVIAIEMEKELRSLLSAGIRYKRRVSTNHSKLLT